MSQNLAVKQGNPTADLKLADLLYATLLHVLVFTIIAALAFWQQQSKPETLKRIEVMMISAKELAKLEQQAHKQAKPQVVKQIKPKPAKPVVKVEPKTKPSVVKTTIKPTVKPTPKPVIKPVVKAVPKAIEKPKPVKQAAKADENFDPFAPMASKTDRKTSNKKASTSQPALADIAGKQLSASEKERYIARMQAAVLRHWKVSVSAAQFSDPLVEMKLMPNGDIASVRILESSGNNSMDASLIRAIRAAAPFELPRQQFEFFRINRIRFHPLK